MSDPTNELCGITIDITPGYSNANIRKQCRTLLWENDEINSKFKRVLEGANIQYMTLLINRQFTPPSYLRVCTDASGYEDSDEGTRIEVFSLDFDFYGDAEMEEKVSDIVMDDSTGRAICKQLRTILVRYIAEILPDAKLKWQLEIAEYRQQ